MGDVRDISTKKDLRSISFAELFYEIQESDDGADIADNIVKKIDPDFSFGRRKKSNISKKKLIKVRKKLRMEMDAWRRDWHWHKTPGKEAVITLVHRSLLFDSVEFRKNSDIAGASDESEEKSYLELFAETKELGIALEVVLVRIADALLGKKDSSRDSMEPSFYLLWLRDNQDVAKQLLELIDDQIAASETELSNQGSIKKYLVALELLPKIKDDQDIIVFFGNNFDTTLANVDAYSGLLYAYEYFEFVGMV